MRCNLHQTLNQCCGCLVFFSLYGLFGKYFPIIFSFTNCLSVLQIQLDILIIVLNKSYNSLNILYVHGNGFFNFKSFPNKGLEVNFLLRFPFLKLDAISL